MPSRYRTFQASSSPPFVPSEIVYYDVLQPNDWTELHDRAWADAVTPAGQHIFYIDGRSSSGLFPPPTLSFAPGMGRAGGNAVRITVDSSSKMPAFWVFPAVSGAGGIQFPFDDRLYTAPRGKRVNFLDFVMKFPPGYLATRAASGSDSSTVGAAQFSHDPGKIPFSPQETDNMHFYWFWRARFDLTSDWVILRVNEIPHVQRSYVGPYARNCPLPFGRFHEIQARFYFEGGVFVGHDDPEIPWPFDVYLDCVRYGYDPFLENTDVTVEFGLSGAKWVPGTRIHVPVGANTDLELTMTNTTNQTINATLYKMVGGLSSATITILDDQANVIPDATSISFAPSEVKNWTYRYNPSVEAINFNYTPGLYLVKDDEIQNANRSDPYVETTTLTTRYIPCGTDGRTYGSHFKMSSYSTAPPNAAPTPLGGEYYTCPQDGTLDGQFLVSDPEGDGYSVAIADQPDTLGTFIITDAATGAFTFTAAPGLTGVEMFKWDVTDGLNTTLAGAWITVE